MDETKQPGIRLVQVFLEKATFKHRPGFLDLPAEKPADVRELLVALETGLTSDGSAALIRTRVRTKPKTEAVYEFDVTMTALLEREQTAPNMPLDNYVSLAGWTLVFPFIREAIANITGRGRFGPVWLSPFNLKAQTGTRRKQKA
ncbi:MAG: protein-export chaperone SecB [Deltaproteobacteria bacterium]|nr:protein-export chaperone SecB [Deltaproteobacteria bacterium]